MKDHLVAAFAHPPVSIFELSCAVEIFTRERPELDIPWYDFAIGALAPGPVASMGGIDLEVAHGIELFERADTIIIPGWNVGAAPPEALKSALLSARSRGARLLSICTGAFLLAAVGLLDGRRAATHWFFASELRRLYPSVEVDPDVLYIDEGDIMTAAGSAAGLDMLLHLVRRDHGNAVCNIVARRLNIPPHREGAQSQFALRPVVDFPDSRFIEVIDWMRENCTKEMRISDLAQQAAMSVRTFFRRFRETTGQSPYDWLIMERVAVARDLLERSGMSIDQIAFHSGFGGPETMRMHFKRIVGRTPVDYRKQFGAETLLTVAAE